MTSWPKAVTILFFFWFVCVCVCASILRSQKCELCVRQLFFFYMPTITSTVDLEDRVQLGTTWIFTRKPRPSVWSRWIDNYRWLSILSLLCVSFRNSKHLLDIACWGTTINDFPSPFSVMKIDQLIASSTIFIEKSILISWASKYQKRRHYHFFLPIVNDGLKSLPYGNEGKFTNSSEDHIMLLG